MHIREQIRDYVAAALAGISAPVEATRLYPLSDSELPSVSVTTGDEESEPATMAGVLSRAVDLVIRVFARGDDTEDQLDDIAVEVENVLRADPLLGGLAKRSTLAGTVTEFSVDGDEPHATLELTYVVLYHASDPETAL